MIRPLKPKLKTILKVAISLAVVAFVLFLWANARPVPNQVQVTFIGFTNLATPFHITQASFCVSNAGGCTVFEGLHRMERKNKPYYILLRPYEWKDELKPTEFKTFSYEPPTPGTNLEPWRLSLSFVKVDWRLKLAESPPRVVRKVLQFVPAKWLEPHLIEVHSDWINGPELMPVAANTTNTPPK